MWRYASLALVGLGMLGACVSSTSDSTAAGVGASSHGATGAGGAAASTSSTSSGAGASTPTASSSASTSTGSTSGGVDYSCEVKSALLHFCIFYQNLDPAELAVEQGDCASVTGTSGTACPTTNVLGTCTGSADGVTGTTSWYSDGGTTAAEAQASCATALGTWTPG